MLEKLPHSEASLVVVLERRGREVADAKVKFVKRLDFMFAHGARWSEQIQFFRPCGSLALVILGQTVRCEVLVALVCALEQTRCADEQNCGEDHNAEEGASERAQFVLSVVVEPHRLPVEVKLIHCVLATAHFSSALSRF